MTGRRADGWPGNASGAHPRGADRAVTMALAALFATGATFTTAGVAGAYRTGPPPAHTGAFGEPHCGACHFDAIRDDDRGGVVIRGPDAYRPGETYTVVVELTHPALDAAGFQLTARLADGPRGGEQAGSLEPMDGRTRVQVAESGVAYAAHAMDGVAPTSEGTARWELRWTAPGAATRDAGTSPGTGPGTVAFDVAAQVANDDDSEFGERYYGARRVAVSSVGACRGTTTADPVLLEAPAAPLTTRRCGSPSASPGPASSPSWP